MKKWLPRLAPRGVRDARWSSPQEMHVAYRRNKGALDDAVVLVSADERSVQALVSAEAEGSQFLVDWETIALVHEGGADPKDGDIIYLLSDGGPADDSPGAISPTALAAFTSRDGALKALAEAHADPSLPDPRLRTLTLGVHLGVEP